MFLIKGSPTQQIYFLCEEEKIDTRILGYIIFLLWFDNNLAHPKTESAVS